MRIQTVPLNEAEGHLLVHNIVNREGRKVVSKGTRLRSSHVAALRDVGVTVVDVAVLDPEDVHEDEAATRLAEAMATAHMATTRGVGGRVNLHTTVLGVLHVEAERLWALNQLPGITLATRPPYTVVRPEKGASQVATLKIIPYAVPERVLAEALALAPGLLDVRPLPARRVALLITGDPAAHGRLRQQFEPPMRARVERLGSQLLAVEAVPFAETAVAEAARRLLALNDMLIVVGQTSVMDEHDLIPRALRAAGATFALHGAPVEPGNLLALAYLPDGRPVLCAPGCARSPSHNVVDMVLPRLLTGERLGRREIAALGLGGLL
ncbi:MAG: molybdopterin-binding protein [Ardenticatenia bacterium]|nr:molybdopterin-binding protein [Ardenticatenia bacterium]